MSKALSRAQLDELMKIVTKLYPASYADGSWDNTGLLIDCSTTETLVVKPKALLTVDLTSAVAQEAIDKNCNVILAYHPFIFPSWKKLSPTSNPQHGSAIKLIQHGISVYCPHTAVDAAKKGVNDWLVGSLGSGRGIVAAARSIESVEPVGDDQKSEVGYGRVVTLNRSLPLSQIITNVKRTLNIDHLQVASKFDDLNLHEIKKIALCAGSGSGVFRNLKEEVDLYYTGELSHHEILKYKEMGKAVIVCNHSNTERQFLVDVMSKKLTEFGIDVVVSENDCDPLRVV
ncbi:LAMI_0D02586g1_1 [Lachancea mirantina]|uniref:LAMI_0D02586g1_1 n=1 Tax=Lachancea mirantina TaxID=1230905 RepID=A0A1G4J9W9_9SACH|nr:LAMI_0D02586g1_1 [Lachancea mirantina]